jgi:hypothetical protein
MQTEFWKGMFLYAAGGSPRTCEDYFFFGGRNFFSIDATTT